MHCSVTGILTSGCVSRRNTSCRRPLCSTSGSWPNTACAHQKPAYSGGLNQMFSYTLSITNKEKFYVKKIQRDLMTACHIPPLKNQRNKGKCGDHPQSHPIQSVGMGWDWRWVMKSCYLITTLRKCLCDYTVTMDLETIPLATGFETSICFFQYKWSIPIIDVCAYYHLRGERFGTFSLYQRAWW